MAHDIHEREGIPILDFKGRLGAGPEATALRETVAELTAAGKRDLALSLAGVDSIDSSSSAR
jgi:anti-anti-sigma regulatory factor